VADVFIVMPDHIHGLVAPQADAPPDDRAPRGSPVFARTVEGFALGAKALIARRLRQSGLVGPRATVWQAGVELHQVRGQAELEALRRHVRENPLRWWRRLGYGFPTPGMAAASDRVAEREPPV
jgi:REP element-mobilizing transposase RayT